jgi:hypothetical protein
VASRSCQLAQAGERGLRGRLAQAQAESTARQTRGRGRRRWGDPRALRAAVDAILTRSRVHGRRHVRDTARCWEHPRPRTGGRDPTVRLAWDGQVPVSLDQEAVAAAVRQLGWRGSVTTQPPAALSLPEAVLAYRGEDLVARAMGRLHGRPPVVDAEVSRAGRPGDRGDPPVVHRVAGPDTAGVWRAPARGQGQGPVGWVVRRQPDAGDRSPDGGTPPGGRSRPDAAPHP